MNYRKINNLTGWIVCAIAATVYIITREATASLWDTGEFIASADKLQVPHPPGSPLFILLGRVFIVLFGANNEAAAVNLMSAVSSGFTILFLFWTITHLARKLFGATTNELNNTQRITVMGAGIVGALAYTFSDSFWFSAVEGEVYALSSFFTALVFWAALKWEQANELAGNDRAARARADRWIIFIFFMIGLSIGVHLLNLLTIPAIVMLYYFRRYKPTRRGTIVAFIAGCVITGFIQVAAIKYSVKLAGKFDVWFVNGLGLPFFSGFIFFFALVALLFWFGLREAKKRKLPFLRLGIWGLTFLLIGYSTYVTTMVRSNANPGIDMNNVDNPITLVSYLGREQYGEAPVFYGPHFAAEVDYDETGNPYRPKGKKYIRGKDGYIYIGREQEVRYAKEDMQLFPRIWDPTNDQGHAQFYADWLDLEVYSDPNTGRQQYEAPTYAHNINWFMTYQAGLMYWRYFMWNFSGKQNDLQGFGNKRDSNWVTGFSFIDNRVLGDQNKLPGSIRHNAANNKLFLIPFILGILGCIYQFIANKKDWIVTFLLFFFTGFAIVVYLNQPGNQPRERDYAYVGSFYAYAIWIGLAVVAAFRIALEKANKKLLSNTLLFGAILVFFIALMSYIYTSGGFVASIFITAICTLIMGALVFVVRFVSGKNLKLAAMASVVLCMSAPVLMGLEEWDDHDRSRKTIARDLAVNYLESCDPNAILISSADNDTYPLWYAQEVENVRADVRIVINTLLATDWLINQLRYKINQSEPIDVIWTEQQVEGHNREALRFMQQGSPNNYYDLYDVMKNVLGKDRAEPNPESGRPQGPESFPVKKFRLPVNRENAIRAGSAKATDTILSELLIELPPNKNVLYRNDMMVLNIIAANNWKRPIYFTNPNMGLGFDQYLRKEGLLYRLVPVPNKNPQVNWVVDKVLTDMRFGGSSVMDTDNEKMFSLLMNKFEFGGTQLPGIYFDEPNRRQLLMLRSTYAEAAGNLADAGKKNEASQLLEKCDQMMRSDNLPYGMVSRFNQHNQTSLVFLEACYKAGNLKLAEKVGKALQKDLQEQKQYYEYMQSEGDNMFEPLRLEQQVNEVMQMVLLEIEKRYRT